MKKSLLAFSLLTPLLLSGCATGYQQSACLGFIHTNNGYGYSEKTLPNGLTEVTFRGNPSTTLDTTYKYVMKRASFVTMKNGYRYFEVISHMNYQKHNEDYAGGLAGIIVSNMYFPVSVVDIKFTNVKTRNTYDAQITSQIQG